MKTLQKKIFYAILIGFTWICVTHGAICSTKDAEAADEIIDKINSWTNVAYVFTQFAPCDDGSIAEGNSEAIARLLIDKWNTLPLLAKLIKQNPPLKTFVLRHINTTLDTDDLEKIAEFSLSDCPKDMKVLCEALNKAAMHALHT